MLLQTITDRRVLIELGIRLLWLLVVYWPRCDPVNGTIWGFEQWTNILFTVMKYYEIFTSFRLDVAYSSTSQDDGTWDNHAPLYRLETLHSNFL